MEDILNIEKIIVLDSGQQNRDNIVVKLRHKDIYSELLPYHTRLETLQAMNEVIGLIIIDHKIKEEGFDTRIFDLDMPILAIGQGAQDMINHYGGGFNSAQGQVKTQLHINLPMSHLFVNLDEAEFYDFQLSLNLTEIPANFKTSLIAEDGQVLGIENTDKNQFAFLFHPSNLKSQAVNQIIDNFIFNICHSQGSWNSENYLTYLIEAIQGEVGEGKVVIGLSGGVDSSILGVLLHKAIGEQLTCIFVDHGLLRKNENDHGITALEAMGLNIIRIDAQDYIFQCLAGLTDPIEKRKAVRDGIIHMIDKEIARISNLNFFALGTLYSNLIELEMNSYGLVNYYLENKPQEIEYLQPFKRLFKSEVRELGLEMNMPSSIVNRQPFPDAGLSIRAFGEVTCEKIIILRETDAILREEIAINGLEQDFYQYFTVLPNVQTSSYEGDRRSYGHLVGIRVITSRFGEKAQVGHLPWEVLETIVNRIINEVPGVSRVVYDITPKPPAMVEWE